MKVSFLFGDSAFLWVRANTLFSFEARKDGFQAANLPHGIAGANIKNSDVLIFSRSGDKLSRSLLWICIQFKIPYILDLDDFVWELPNFSKDYMKKDKSYENYLEKLIKYSIIITVSTDFLNEKLKERYPDKKIITVKNSSPNSNIPKGGAIIANTDSFKMDDYNTMWFVDILEQMSEAGVPVKLLGDNENILKNLPDFKFYHSPTAHIHVYMHILLHDGFSFGLIPVDNSKYADAKSDIKIQDFLNAGIPVIASNILPYKLFKDEFPESRVTIVENTEPSWRKAVEKSIANIPKNILEENKEHIKRNYILRSRQYNTWKEILSLSEIRLSSGNKSIFNFSVLILKIFYFFYLRFNAIKRRIPFLR